MMGDHGTPGVQVEDGFYDFSNYVTEARWASFWHQIRAVLGAKPASVLEIGPGFGATTFGLRRAGVAVTTFDFDASLKPDIVGDVRRLGELVPPATYDTVCAFQILEHLPFEDFPLAIKAIAGAARRNVVISLPHWGYPLELRFRFLKNRLSGVFSRKISRNPKWKFDGQHYWELGTHGYSVDMIVRELEKHLIVRKKYFCPDYSYHYFFECEVR